MLRAATLVLLVLMAAVGLATCQTFQYSRGWTNGKRADGSPIASILELKSAEVSQRR